MSGFGRRYRDAHGLRAAHFTDDDVKREFDSVIHNVRANRDYLRGIERTNLHKKMRTLGLSRDENASGA